MIKITRTTLKMPPILFKRQLTINFIFGLLLINFNGLKILKSLMILIKWKFESKIISKMLIKTIIKSN